MNVGLGTVQFGLNYGVSNVAGRTPFDEVVRILRFAAAAGLRVLDTSPSYGVSEEVLGAACGEAGGVFKVVTKARPEIAGPHELARDLDASLDKLRSPKVYGLLVHRSDDLLAPGGPALYAELNRLKQQGLVEKIGVSVYDSAEIDQLLGRYPVDLMQVPVSVLDQRLVASGHLARMKDLGIEIHARSVFLQGLLLLEPGHLSVSLRALGPALSRFRSFVEESGMTPLEGALNFVAQIPEIDVALCGVNTLAQLTEIVQAHRACPEPREWRRLAVDEERFVNPAAWV